MWDPYTVGSIKKIESVQRRAARFTLGRYRRTSSVNAMLTRLNWEPLASRWHAARLLMFYKIHYGLVATPMPLDIKKAASCTHHASRKLSGLPHPTVIMWLSPLFFFPRTVRDWNILSEVVVRASSPELSSFLLVICVVDINLDVVPLPIVNKHVHKRYGSSYTLADNKRVNT